jgi:hypothetical protein
MRRKISPTGTSRTRITPSRKSRNWRSRPAAFSCTGRHSCAGTCASTRLSASLRRARRMTMSPIIRISSSSRARSTRTKCADGRAPGGAGAAGSAPTAMAAASGPQVIPSSRQARTRASSTGPPNTNRKATPPSPLMTGAAPAISPTSRRRARTVLTFMPRALSAADGRKTHSQGSGSSTPARSWLADGAGDAAAAVPSRSRSRVSVAVLSGGALRR